MTFKIIEMHTSLFKSELTESYLFVVSNREKYEDVKMSTCVIVYQI